MKSKRTLKYYYAKAQKEGWAMAQLAFVPKDLTAFGDLIRFKY
ncbi:MAG: hypothetical protein AAB567_01570 [Patescibacteria group bacterium]